MSSKLRKLKQQAYEAGKKRDWPAAMDAYGQILEFDKNNPSLLNEYGDVCLKAGETAKALRQFLSAASRYKTTGLLNNAQAVYKKVLRHDPENLNANWFLAEVRASQGLMADGEHHALRFLQAAENVSGEIKEIFLKRCLELLTLYPESAHILEQLTGIFRLREMPLESARASCLRACLLHCEGEEDAAAQAVAGLLKITPELANYPEYSRWQELTGARTSLSTTADVNTIDFGAAEPDPDDATAEPEASAEPEAAYEPEPEPGPDAATEVSFAGLAADFDQDLDGALEPGAVPAGSAWTGLDSDPVVDREGTADLDSDLDDDFDDEDCITLDDPGNVDFAALMDDLAGLADEAAAALEREPAAPPAPPAADRGAGSVNLLDEILAEEGEDLLRSSDTEQVSTIAREIGRNVGEAQDADPEAQYQQGLVYLELGLYDQAALALEAASRDAAHALQAREMWGIALQRAGQPDEALAVFEAGLAGDQADRRLALGLHYHAGCILQELGRHDEAQQHFVRVHEVDAGFADVARRLRTQKV
ncbi:MAG: hypothetical protein R3D98_12435 [Candidatus Krumholzibacteriia bacterium]